MWVIGKSRKYLWGSEFTVLSYCSGMQELFESESSVPHVVQIWRAKLLQYQFLIWNRTAIMMWECDMLSQYNKATESCKENDVGNAPT